MKKVLVLGSTSAIAQATVRLLAARGASLYLTGRNAANLDAVTKDAATRGAAKVASQVVDLNDFDTHEAQKAGTLVVISSVAGDRGRQSNYVYGASKGALNVFLQGLRNRMAKSKVAVVTVKPGFVDTPMTAHLPKNKLFASPEKVARGLLSAADARKNEVYVPGIWALIMLIIRTIPETLFKRMKL
ncbi:SDR family NAD(P)-dependent oxidoreductase [Myxococcus xanthus]|uniref:SDR family NAD(P)-dependent oxidoreductase n=1 Tax=Myxococcus xanthus TaxID=34 RepID=UPI00112CF4F1|nr:SDR family NAD(P)-dependent oxidoreductase [Myxococcus xanthus]QDF06843.1 short-chain dehydrogenase [Myxococcus xanthus]